MTDNQKPDDDNFILKEQPAKLETFFNPDEITDTIDSLGIDHDFNDFGGEYEY